ncbi:MAG: hypothetical protein L6R43_06005 [Planctomycetes bacterium]|nr:hypothetical protein [Planctomycetota bacterium]
MRAPPRPLVLLCVVVAAALAAYLPCLSFDWAYDDGRFVAGNGHLDGMAAAPWRAFDPGTTTMDGAEPGMWRPLRTLSFALDRALFGTAPGPAHLASVLLHGVATGLVFALGMTVGMDDLAAAAGAAIFALHPAQAEAVAWVSARGDLLPAVLLLAAVLVHLRRRGGGGAWTAVLCGLAFLAKESAVVAPLLLFAADLAAGGRARLRERWRTWLPSAGVLAALVAVRAAVLSLSGVPADQGEGLGLGAAGTALEIPGMFGWYAWRFLLPSPGVFDLQALPALVLLPLVLVGLLDAALALRRPEETGRRSRVRGGVLLWALAALLPVTILQVLFPLKILVADRFLYLALAGPALAAGAAAGSLGPGAARAAFAGSALLLLATAPARDRWASDEALWGDTLARTPGNARALHGLAHALEAKDGVRSLSLYRAAVEAEPGNAPAWFRKGLLEERTALGAEDTPTRTGMGLRAVESLHRAIRLWLEGEREGRERGLVEARLARAALLASLGEEAPAAVEAMAGYDLWTAAAPPERERLLPRVAALRRWARERGRTELLARLGGEGGL